MPKEITPGLEMETVGDLIGGEAEAAVAKPVTPPKLPNGADFPTPGIYFGMPEEIYHAIHACSASGIKAMSVSSMDYWANSVLNPEKEEEADGFTAKDLGRAYHCRICEGRDVYVTRYAPALDKDDYVDLVVTVKDIRHRLEHKHGIKPKGTAKEALIAQLLDAEPEAPVWDKMVEAYERENEGKILVPFKLYRRIEIAAAMIAGDPQLRHAFTGGHAEVSIFWHDEATGAPMKARLDYVKLAHLIDLKSFANKMGKPVQRAIDQAIANEKYYIPVVVYLEAIAAAKAMIKKDRGHVFQVEWDREAECLTARRGDGVDDDLLEWCWKWAHQPEPEVLFVFQQTGKSPVTRGRIMVKGGVYSVTRDAVQFLKRKWVRCANTYGTDPWLDIEPVVRTVDESLGMYAADFGDTA